METANTLVTRYIRCYGGRKGTKRISREILGMEPARYPGCMSRWGTVGSGEVGSCSGQGRAVLGKLSCRLACGVSQQQVAPCPLCLCAPFFPGALLGSREDGSVPGWRVGGNVGGQAGRDPLGWAPGRVRRAWPGPSVASLCPKVVLSRGGTCLFGAQCWVGG